MFIRFIISLMLPLNIFAASLENIEFEDKINLQEQELVVNGLGLRLATLFKVKVYVAGLYLDKKLSSWKEIQNNTANKKIRLAFLTSVDKKKLQEAWKEAYKNNLDSETFSKISSSLNKMNLYMKSMKKGQNMEIQAYKDTVDIFLKGSKVVSIKDAAFSKYFLAAFIGPNPPNKELKEGLLGL